MGERAVQARLHPPRPVDDDDDADQRFGRRFGRAFPEGDAPVPTIALHSPPLLVFFQSLLPWGELDRSGVRVQPVTWASVAQGTAECAKGLAIFFLAIGKDLI